MLFVFSISPSLVPSPLCNNITILVNQIYIKKNINGTKTLQKVKV